MLSIEPPNLNKLLVLDTYLVNFQSDIINRYTRFQGILSNIEEQCGGLDKFTISFQDYGARIRSNNDVSIKEWIPSAKAVYICGDFNNWNCFEHPLTKNSFGIWSIILKNVNGKPMLNHLERYKFYIETSSGKFIYRLSPWSVFVVPNGETKYYETLFWNPPIPYEWKHNWPLKTSLNSGLRIYEAHIGISTEEYGVATYNHFREKVLPHIIYLGYNSIQFMAVMEHAYYACFGYQVTSFFAPSCRYGTPDELKQLIDTCHAAGIRVFLDIVHSHACKNTEDGLNEFDGSDSCFFHSGSRGYHKLWDSRLFDYTQIEVLRFLLSNLRWYVEEFRFDGFRFDGVTSMLYHDHGIGTGFSGNYHEYFNTNVDVESLNYLQIANYMLHKFYPNIITIAEEVSGMPALCRPVEEGGLGFDYRLAMAIPDKWIKILKENKDEEWNMWDICWTLINRRYGEKAIAYCESHDQALVGDKSLAFWLMDAEMYHNMSCLQPKSVVTDRGMALHKMIRLITFALGGEGYLNFIGNEFGHPEWLDFPREGNGNSYHYARRQWHLVHDENLRYRFLNEFDRVMNESEDKYKWLIEAQPHICHHEDDKIIYFQRGKLVFIFNFHPSKSFTDYLIGVRSGGCYKIVFDSDELRFDGHGRCFHSVEYTADKLLHNNMEYSLRIYIPSRVVIVLTPIV